MQNLRFYLKRLLNKNSKREIHNYLEFKKTSWFGSEFTRTEMLQNLQWLKKQLKLDGLKFDSIYTHPALKNRDKYPALSERQIYCFNAVVENCNANELNRAYHEFGDFIQNYGIGFDRECSLEEKTTIKTMIDLMIPLCK